jgi:hypothetical protein
MHGTPFPIQGANIVGKEEVGNLKKKMYDRNIVLYGTTFN